MPTSTDIKTAALRLLEHQDPLTVSAICREAGASNGSFFHFFPSKDALIGALYLDGLRSYHARIESVLEGSPPAREGIAAAIGAYLDWIASQRGFRSLVLGDDQSRWMREIRREQQAENRRFRTVMERWRADLVERGEIADVDVDMLIAVIVGPAQILCKGWRGGRLPDPRQRKEDLVAIAQRALLR